LGLLRSLFSQVSTLSLGFISCPWTLCPLPFFHENVKEVQGAFSFALMLLY